MSPRPWKVEYAVSDRDGDEVDWLDDRAEAIAAATAAGGRVTKIERYADEREVIWPEPDDEDD